MPFDSTGFPRGEGPGDRRPAGGDPAAVIVLILGALLLLTPFSLPAFTHLVRFLLGK